MGPPHSFIAHLHWHALAVFQVLILLLWTPSANGAVTNTTVDDTDSAFTFTGSWTAVSASDPCSFCSSKPDPTQTFDQTWHDGNYRTGASETTTGSFTFTGSAVYIYGIDQAKSQPDIAFTLGSTQAVHHYTGTEQFVYNALFFSATGLADETHTVNWIFNIDPSTGVGVQEALFDYAIVTSGTDNAPDPNPTDNTPIIITTTTQQTTSPTKPSTQTSPSSSTASSPSTANKLVSSPSAVGKPSSTSIAQQAATSPSSAAESGTASGALTTAVPQSAASSSSRHTTATSAVIGAVLGALLLAILVLVLCFLRRRRMQRAQALEDDERRAAGLPPAPAPPPRMRMRIRGGNYVLQPFVDDRPPDAPAGNVFAAGTFATAASARAGSNGGVSPGADTGTVIAGMGAGAGAAAVRQYPLDSKTMDIGYTNANLSARQNTDVSRQPSQSRSELSRIDTLMAPGDKRAEAQAEAETEAERETVVSPSSAVSPSARERYLEQRLAMLEAHVASYLPPPYEQPGYGP